MAGLVSQVDVLPTLLDLLDLPASEAAQGHSVTALLRDGGPGRRETVFAERNYDPRLQPTRMARNTRWKYVRKASAHCIYDEVIQELELAGTNFRQAREIFEFYSARRVMEELYDLEADPSELHNLAEDPASRGRA